MIESYRELAEAVCEEVYCFGEFGSYQGDWWAKIKYNGQIGWIHGYYGTCAYCDWLSANYKLSEKKLKQEFITEYLDNILNQEQAEKEASRNIDWDLDAQDMLNFIKNNTIE